MNEKGKYLSGIVLFFIFIFLVFCTSSASAYFDNTASLYFDKNLKSVDVSPASSGTVIFKGILNVSVEYITEISLSTRIYGDETVDWISSVSPSYIRVMGGSENIPVTVCVKVPTDTSHTVSGKIRVKVHATPWGTGTIPIDADTELFVTVKPYYHISVYSDTPYQEVPPHTFSTFYIYISNHGNADITDIKIKVNTDKYIETSIVSLSRVKIDSKKTVGVPVKIETLRSQTMWIDKIQRVTITIESTNVDIHQSYDIYLRIRGTYIPDIETSLAIIILCVMSILFRRLIK